MFTYAQGPALKKLLDSKVDGAGIDDWLEGWAIGTLTSLMAGKWPARILDIEIGGGARPYRKAAAGSSLTPVQAGKLDSISQAFDLVLALSFERAECLAPVDPDHAYRQADLLSTAARRLAPGGIMIWSYLYAYADDDTVYSLLEPAALFRNLVLRGLEPIDRGMEALEKVRLYHDPRTLFVNQRAVLQHSDRQRRIVRVFGAVRSPHEPTSPWWKRWRGRR